MRIRCCFVACLVVVLAGTSAGAKDLRRADPAPKPTGCEWAGEGFAKMPGTDTCVKVGGFVRAETSISSGGAAFFPSSK